MSTYSQGLNQLTQDNIRWGPSSSVDSPPASVGSVIKDSIPVQKTPETKVNESFHSFPSPPIPNTIVFQDVASPSSSLEEVPTQLELGPEESMEEVPTRLEPGPEETTMMFSMLTCPPHMNIENNNNHDQNNNDNNDNNDNNNKKRKAALLLDAIIPHPKALPVRVVGNCLFLRVELLCYLNEKQKSDFKTLRENIVKTYGGLPCRNCNHMDCKDKINIRHVMGVAKLMAFIRSESVFDGTWAEVLNHKYFRLQYHQFYCDFLNLTMPSTPPSDCLERDMIALFPSPNDLPDHHHLKQRKDAPSKWMQNYLSNPMKKHWYLVE